MKNIKSKKICFCCNEYPPFLNGGIGSVVKNLAEGLRNLDISPIVIGIYNLDKTKVLRVNNIPLVCIKRSKIKLFGIAIDRIRFYFVLRKIVIRYKVEFIEDNDWDLCTAFLPNIKNSKFTLRLHHGRIIKIKSLSELGNFQSILLKNVISKSYHIISVSNVLLKGYEVFFNKIKNKASIIYNGISISKEICKLDRHRKQILFVGTLTTNKGILTLIDALVMLSDEINGLELIIAGKEGKIYGKKASTHIENILKETRVKLNYLGHVSKTELSKYYQKIGVFVLPSYFESFGLSVVEAMSYGCPSIFTKTTSGPEIIDDGINGYLVNPNDKIELLEKLKILLKDDNIYYSFIEESKKKVLNKFDLNEIINKNYSLYENL